MLAREVAGHVDASEDAAILSGRATGLRPAAVIPDLRGIREVVLDGLGLSVLPAHLASPMARIGFPTSTM